MILQSEHCTDGKLKKIEKSIQIQNSIIKRTIRDMEQTKKKIKFKKNSPFDHTNNFLFVSFFLRARVSQFLIMLHERGAQSVSSEPQF